MRAKAKPPENAPGRRVLLGGTAALLAGAAVTPTGASSAAESPDAELIRLCQEFIDLENVQRSRFSILSPSAEYEEKRDADNLPLEARQDVIADQIAEMSPPQTIEGVRAIAGAIAAWAPDMLTDEYGELGGLHGILNSALLRGLVGEARA